MNSGRAQDDSPEVVAVDLLSSSPYGEKYGVKHSLERGGYRASGVRCGSSGGVLSAVSGGCGGRACWRSVTIPATPPTAADAMDARTASAAISGLSRTKISTATMNPR
jgi:hypothetical protein